MQKHKKTLSERKQDLAISAVKKAAGVFAWNVDRSFALLLAPIIKRYIRDASKIIDFSDTNMRFFDKLLCKYGNNFKIMRPVIKRIKEETAKRYVMQLDIVYSVLQDIIEEESEAWNKRWNITPLLKVEYDFEKYEHPKLGPMYKTIVKDKYKENNIKNLEIIRENAKKVKKCIKWRKKHLHWFIKNLEKLWW